MFYTTFLVLKILFLIQRCRFGDLQNFVLFTIENGRVRVQIYVKYQEIQICNQI